MSPGGACYYCILGNYIVLLGDYIFYKVKPEESDKGLGY